MDAKSDTIPGQKKRKGGRFERDPQRLADALVGRRAPHNLDMEQALLACCILEGGQESLSLCVEEKIKPESFYKPSHQSMYAALEALYREGVAIDEIILADKLEQLGHLEDVGGHAYIMEVTNRIDTPSHLPHYLRRVRDNYLLREVIRVSMHTVEQAYADVDDIDHFVESVEKSIFEVGQDRISDSAQHVSESVDSAIAMVNQLLQNKGELTGITTGFLDLDKLTTGLHSGEMVVVAARPAMGKTSLALNMIEAAICPKAGKQPVPTMLFSLEMPAEQLAMRLVCSRSRVNMRKLRDGFIPKDKQQDLSKCAQELKAAPLYIDDSSGLTILELRAKARRIANKLKHKLGLVVVDYLQLVAGTDSRVPREQQIAEISRGMKGMAKELGVPVVVLGQLNRESEKEKRQPRISDLRESGSIEQDADIVLLLSKPRDYNEEEDLANEVVARDLIIAKQRNGPIGTVPLHFTKNLTRFENYTPHSV